MTTGYFSFGTNPGTALWDWDTSVPGAPVMRTFSNKKPTKTGLLPEDLQKTVGIPLQYYAAGGGMGAVPPEDMIDWIRQAEDWVEQETNLLLTPTWVASPPEIQHFSSGTSGAPALDGIGQRLGVDYDLADAGYDFYADRAIDNSWLMQALRYRPLRNVTVSALDFTSIKNVSSVYPLLSQFFRIPPTWYVEDEDAALVRMVPNANVAMLPLFALQLQAMGGADTIPGAWHYQYTAGLTVNDLRTRFSFLKRLVLVDAAIKALGTVQGTINMGLMRVETLIDGLQVKLQYSESGPFGSIIKGFRMERDELLNTALTKVAGPMLVTL